MGLNQSHWRTPVLLIQELKRQQILTYETVSQHTEFYCFTIKHAVIWNWARNDNVECYIYKGNYSITDSHPSTRTQCTKYGQQVLRKVLQILCFEQWGVLLYIKFESTSLWPLRTLASSNTNFGSNPAGHSFWPHSAVIVAASSHHS
jgi:hypothetical protein